MNGLRPQSRTEATASARSRAYVKVTRPAAVWREMYDVEGIGVAVHRAILENA